MSEKILIAEDNKDILNLLRLHLTKEGYTVICAENGNRAIEIFNNDNIDLVILDIMMPGADGFEVLQHIRKTSMAPVIFLTARSEESDKVLGLDLGADDYVSKPFSPIEIVSRVKAQLRRFLQYSGSPKNTEEVITNGPFELHPETHKLTKNGIEINLNPKEMQLLTLFMKSPGKVFTKKMLYELVWEGYYYSDNNTLMVHMSHLRDKIEDNPRSPRYLKTIHSIGYKMEILKDLE